MSKPSAMIIDDHGDSAVIFSEAMRLAGFAIEIIVSGDEALERLEKTTPSVVILDICLPRLAGAYVIVITADPLSVDAVRQLADQVLVKPIGFCWLRDLATELAERGDS